MISMKATPPVPQDREVEVTVTLTFRESDLRMWADGLALGKQVAKKFYDDIARGFEGNSLYDALDKLT